MDLPNDIKHLYITWLEEDVLAYSIRAQKMAMLYTRALEKLRNYPEPILTPRELIKVPFIGEKIVGQMEKRLATYCKENGYKIPLGTSALQKCANGAKRSKSQQDPIAGLDDERVKTKRTKRKYVPVKRSGGYAILLSLLQFDSACNGMTKDAIIENCTSYCDKSFTANPSTNQFYSAWSSVKSLLNNELVKVEGRPAHYYLTDEGKELAQNLKVADGIVFMGERSRARPSTTSSSPNARGAAAIAHNERITMDKSPRGMHYSNRVVHSYNGVNYQFWEPGSFTVRFVVDNREVRSSNERDFFYRKLQQLGVDVESRSLTVGDGLWIARNKTTKEEAVLDYIIERKRLDDLASSIKDGRYNEQKARLKRSAVKNVFYLIEEVTSSDVQQMADAIQTAIGMALTTSDFHVKRTKDADDTTQFISKITKQIINFYSERKLLVLEPRNLKYQQDYKKVLDQFRDRFGSGNVECAHKYSTFDTMLSKTKLMTTREMFIRMLMTIRGVSLEKAIAIQKDFKTPKDLIQNFNSQDPELAKRYGKRVQELINDVFKK